MQDNWVEANTYYSSQPTINARGATVHKDRDEAVVLEETSGNFVILVTEKDNPQKILHTVGSNYDSYIECREAAQIWISNHPNGLSDVDEVTP